MTPDNWANFVKWVCESRPDEIAGVEGGPNTAERVNDGAAQVIRKRGQDLRATRYCRVA